MIQEIREAHQRIRAEVIRTPLIYSHTLSQRIGAKVYLKCENLQKTGSFKIRGAANRLSLLTSDEKSRGIVAISAGNHAQGVASQAARLGISCTVFMPKTAPLTKITSTRAWGADVQLVGASVQEAFEAGYQYQKQTGATLIHPFADPEIMAGQGTVGLEILEDLPNPDWIFCPVGGGGLAAGLSSWIHGHLPSCQVIGVQVDRAPAVTRSFQTGVQDHTPATSTLADGLAVKNVDMGVVSILRQKLSGMVAVSEEEVIASMGMILEETKQLVEGGGGVGLAAAIRYKAQLSGKNVVIILSGGNVDLNILERVVDRTLRNFGRLSWITVQVPDKPGSLQQIAAAVATQGANILQVSQERSAGKLVPFGMTEVKIELETASFEHLESIKQQLLAGGFLLS